MKKWNELTKGDQLIVAFPALDGSYDIQDSEVIQMKQMNPDNPQSPWYLKFKYTNTNGKRQRCQCYIYNSNVEHSVLFCGDYKVLTPKRKAGEMIVSCAEDRKRVEKAIRDVAKDCIFEYQCAIQELQAKVDKLKKRYEL